MRPFILISNDDGYQALGINYLIDTLRPVADLLVVAPDGPRSGFSCAITTQVHMTLRTVREEEGLTVMACSGSPVDCVKMAFNVVLPRLYGTVPDPADPQSPGHRPARMPDLVIGGINHGDNSSVNTYYSGTMGVVTEGTFQGVPSIGFSLCDMSHKADFSACGEWIVKIVKKVLKEGLPPFTCLNVNFPHISAALPAETTAFPTSCPAELTPVEGGSTAPHYKGLRICRMAKSTWVKEVAEAQRPGSGSTIYWLTGEVKELEPEATDTDRWALYNGYVAVTPQTLDSTAYTLLGSWKL